MKKKHCIFCPLGDTTTSLFGKHSWIPTDNNQLFEERWAEQVNK